MKRVLLALPFAMALGSPADADTPLGTKPMLHTPDVIAPAVLPYLACLYAERGLPLLRATDGSQVAYDHSDGSCSAARARAQADATKLLSSKPVPGGLSAAELIDETLADMDAYVVSLPMSPTGATASASVVGLPVTIEDEVQPAYRRYDDCLKTQVSSSRVTVDTVISTFKSAMAVCASVRDLAVSEAQKALIAKGWDEAARTRAATNTFAKVDQSWLALGEQYRQAMVRHIAAMGKAPTVKARP